MSEKKLGGHCTYLWNIVQNIAKTSIFCSIFRGEPGASFYKSWLKSNKFQSFQLILPILNLTV